MSSLGRNSHGRQFTNNQYDYMGITARVDWIGCFTHHVSPQLNRIKQLDRTGQPGLGGAGRPLAGVRNKRLVGQARPVPRIRLPISQMD